MTVKTMIEMLRDLPPDAEVLAWDGDADAMMPVTGCVHGDDGSSPVELSTEVDP